ncbi:hypothetical protein BP6252_04583 [Coleophoma cylindrospora]|uniref:Roadblock/LAMTOR2 domain-containing protein n=1 Tax=Coleophoma cylindrospora TaxID=1849047 RepID=A0A3D8S0Z0_9HELO|nr:hypothetical protein BP6252_04583 [Coleophoma cylindrospora]
MQVDPLKSDGTATALEEHLQRLGSKSGVVATVVVDTPTGAIIKSQGELPPSHGSRTRIGADEETASGTQSEGIEELASMVWNFVKAAGGLVQGLDSEDELKLLRLRTKKYELVIVPDAKYLLIVVHNTPAA